jgi:hypothetical protein
MARSVCGMIVESRPLLSRLGPRRDHREEQLQAWGAASTRGVRCYGSQSVRLDIWRSPANLLTVKS